MTFPGYPPSTIRPLMKPEGKGTSRVLAIGEALGENEERDQLPFRPYAEAGSLLERALWRAGIPRESLTLSNLVWYRPPNNLLAGAPYEMDAIRACASLNDELVERVKPKVILALGGLAFRELTGLSGEKAGITQARGMVCAPFLYKGIPTIGTYHPSFLRRGSKERSKEGSKTEAAGGGTQGMALLGVLIRDLQLAIQIGKDGLREFRYEDYKLGASLDDWDTFYLDCLAHPDLPISYDWETPFSKAALSEDEIESGARERDILQGQMSLRPGQAIVSPFNPDLLPIWERIFKLPNPKIGWNSRKFDDPEARSYGLTLEGELHDLMDFWHHLQPDLPRGLQYATSFFCPEVGPWKHLIHDSPLWYGALDVDMPQRIWAGLSRTARLMREPHSGRSLWDGYREQIVLLSPVLNRMSERGQPVNEEKRLALDKEFEATQARIGDALNELVPEEIRNVDPKEGFKRNNRLPQACLEAAGQILLFEGPEGVDEPTQDNVLRRHEATRVVDNGVTYVTRIFKDPKKGPVQRWARLLPFNTGSQQVRRYIQWQIAQESEKPERLRKYFHPISPKTDSQTTDKLGLHKLLKATNDPVIKLILEEREVGTARGTFVAGWKGGRDGRVHSTFGYKPATGQLSSENPNAQNFPKHREIARAMNRMIEASPGKSIISFDWKSFHVLTTGFEAKDPLYMRMARLDMHSFFALVGLLRLEAPEKVIELPDAELKAKLAWYRKQEKIYPTYACQGHPAGMTFGEIRDEQAKTTILGVGFGQQAMGMFKRNPDSFKSSREAKVCLDMLNRLFPKEETWRGAVRHEADVQSFLLTRYGYVRRFWDVFTRKIVSLSYEPRNGQSCILDAKGRKWLLGPGDDHEAVVAYRPANDAFGLKRAVMVEIGERGLDERYGLFNEIHDCLKFECPDPLRDECLETIKGIMERPSSVLVDPDVAPGGLWCQVDMEIGRNQDRKDASNPTGMEKIK
jgi:uracil-DNA glycosylase family 4